MATKRKPSDDDLPGEVWLPVVGFENYYAVSSEGRVKRTGVAPTATKPGPTYPGKVLRGGMDSDGYPTITLRGGVGESRFSTIHRLVTAAFFGPRPPGHEVNHIDGTKTNNAARNLEYVTHRANRLHATRVLGGGTGSRNGNARLSEADIPVIRRRLADGETQSTIATDYGVSQMAIWAISSGKTWGQVV
jgi:hypothetical protein